MRFLDPRVRRGLACILVPLIAGSCADNSLEPPPPANTSGAYWSLTLDHRSITLSTVAPYDTATLVATPRDAAGNAMAGLPAATYRSTDLAHVQVTPDGHVRAIEAGNALQVIASLTANGVTHTDTATLKVTSVATPPTLDSLSIHPLPPDSAKWPLRGILFGPTSPTLNTRLLDTTHTPLSGLPVDYRTSDPTVATVNSAGVVQALRPGQFTIYASATVYGVTRADTLPFTIGWPIYQNVWVCQDGPQCPGFSTTATVAVGGTIFWFDLVPNADGTDLLPIDIVFDEPANVAVDPVYCNCGAGDIATFGSFTDFFRSRTFPVAGTYTYHSTAFPWIQGKVVVVTDETLPATRQLSTR